MSNDEHTRDCDDQHPAGVGCAENSVIRRADNLVERGLERYGQGDLRGAMSEWEHALAIRPTHELAREYVEYVRTHFDALSLQLEQTKSPWEISSGSGLQRGGVSRMGQHGVEEGWGIDDDYLTSLPPPPVGLTPVEELAEELGAVREGLLDIGDAEGPVSVDGHTNEPSRETDFSTEERTTPGGGQKPLYSDSPVLSEDAISGLHLTPDAASDIALGTTHSEDETRERDPRKHLVLSEEDIESESLLNVFPEADQKLDDSPDLAFGTQPAVQTQTSEHGPGGVFPAAGQESESTEVVEPPANVVARGFLEDLDADISVEETPPDRTRRRVSRLIERAAQAHEAGEQEFAVALLAFALEEDPESAVAQKVIHQQREVILRVYQSYFGAMTACPALGLPMHELAQHQLDNRVAFLLSRIDGSLSFEEILDVSGMTRLETCRYLAEMITKGILEIR